MMSRSNDERMEKSVKENISYKLSVGILWIGFIIVALLALPAIVLFVVSAIVWKAVERLALTVRKI